MLTSFFRVERPAVAVAIIAFCVALASGLLIQLTVLPIWLPGLHGGNGLLLGSDSGGFHRLAVDLAFKMHYEGWGAWELRPHGQAPAGIAAILYYLFVPSPLVLLPLNATLFSLAALLVFSMVRQVVVDASTAFYVSLLFIATPSSVMWYSQIHKEMLFVPAILLQIWVWLFVVRGRADNMESVGAGRTSCAVLVAVLSSGLIWIVRPYFLSIVAVSNLLVALYVVVAFRRNVTSRFPAFCALAIVLVLVPVLTKQIGQMSGVSSSSARFMRENSLAKQPNRPDASGGTVVDAFVRTLNISRDGFAELGGGSDLFGEVRFASFGDVVIFSPTALAISMLAPFPNAWFANARQPGGQMMRTVSALEMLFGYFGLGFLLIRLVQKGRPSRLVGIVMVFSLPPLLIWGAAIPNIGTLYRFRAPLWTLLVLFGWAFAIHQLKIRRLHRDR